MSECRKNVTKSRFVLCMFEHLLYARPYVVLGGYQHLHPLLTEDRKCFQSHCVWTWTWGLSGVWAWDEEGKGEYCTVASTGKRWGCAGKRGSSFRGWPTKGFLTFPVAALARAAARLLARGLPELRRLCSSAGFPFSRRSERPFCG